MVNNENFEVLLKMLVILIILVLFIILNIITPNNKFPINYKFNGTYLSSDYVLLKNNEPNITFIRKVSNKYKKNEFKCLALNMYHEARGEGKLGMLMVGHVTMNRVNNPNYPNTICEVVYQPKQFSWIHILKNHTPTDSESWELAQKLAKQVINRKFDRSNGALFFHNKNLNPKWSKKKQIQKLDTYKNHIFYALSTRLDLCSVASKRHY